MLSLLHEGSQGAPLPPDASHEQRMAAILRSPAATWHGQASGALVAIGFDLAGAPAPPFEASLLPGRSCPGPAAFGIDGAGGWRGVDCEDRAAHWWAGEVHAWWPCEGEAEE